MPQPKQPYHSQLFTIRMWPEEVRDNQIEWRGQVWHIPSDQMRYFRDWLSLTDFLERTLAYDLSVPQSGREMEEIGDDLF